MKEKKISFSSVDIENAFCLNDSTELIYVPVPLYSNTQCEELIASIWYLNLVAHLLFIRI